VRDIMCEAGFWPLWLMSPDEGSNP